MSRFIDADALRHRVLYFADARNLNGNHEQAKAYNHCLIMIDESKTVDVVEVVHGEWIAEEIHNCWTEFECSVCKFKHKSAHNFGKPITEFNYCPHCGADMRGGNNEQIH